MTEIIPERIPDCAVRLLARPEWFADPGIVRRAKLKLASGVAAFLSSERFSKGRTKAITLGKTIYFCGVEQFQPHTVEGLALIAHELKHVEQYERDKLLGFYIRYLFGYIRHGNARDLGYESTAYAFEDFVKDHLQDEFNENANRDPCIQIGESHTPNLEFILREPIIFSDNS